MSNSTSSVPLQERFSFIETTDQTSSFIETNETSSFMETSNETTSFIETTSQISSFIETTEGPDSFNYTIGRNETNPEDWGIIVTIIIVGFIGNILVYVMMSDKKLNYLSYTVYLRALALFDTTSMLFGSRLMEQTEDLFALPHAIEVSDVLCKLLPGIRKFTVLLSPWLVVALTLDRYVCVCFPLKRQSLCTKKKAMIICSCLFFLSIVLVIPIPIATTLTNGVCGKSMSYEYYSMFIRLVVSSIIPCLVILLLNIMIVVRIQRSNEFRNTFSRSSSTASREQDHATRPLVLISVLAFITLVPISATEWVMAFLQILKTDVRYRILGIKFWHYFNVIYMLNFGQNFYILIGSSSNYRNIMRRKLGCYNEKRNEESQNRAMTNLSTVSNISTTISGLALSADTKDSASVAIASDKLNSELSTVSAGVTGSACFENSGSPLPASPSDGT